MSRKNAPPLASRNRFAFWIALALLVIVLDQLTKLVVAAQFQLGDAHRVTSFFELVRWHNTGAAFSFLAGAAGWQRWFFVGLGAVVTTVILVMLRRHGYQTLFALALTLIMGGAIGNVIDRLWHGYVIDFLHFHWGTASFPAFNLADCAISVGAALYVLDEWRRVRQSKG